MAAPRTLLLVLPILLGADTPDSAPTLPPPRGRVVKVSDVRALQDAVRNLAGGTTILIAAGTYRLTGTLRVGGSSRVENVALRGATGKPEDVVILGEGMGRDSKAVPHGIMVSNAENVLIADLSVGEVRYHPIALQAIDGCGKVRIYHCRLFDAGEQFVKASTGKGGRGGVDGGVVEYCTIEYAKEGPENGYTNGVDVHWGRGWVVRHNLFRNIRVPERAKYRNVPAVLMWNGSKDTVCESNTFVNCERAIAFGLMQREGRRDHEGGVIRNNFIFMAADGAHHPDAGILVFDSPGTKVLHNTVILSGAYPNAIECRFGTTEGVVVANNLTDAEIRMRDGAKAERSGNFTKAKAAWFVAPEKGDLHLTPKAGAAIGKGTRHPDCAGDFDGAARDRRVDLGADEYRKGRPKK